MRRTAFKRKAKVVVDDLLRLRDSLTDAGAPPPKAKRKPLAPRSKKTRAKYDGTELVEGRRDLVARLLRERPFCETCPRITTVATVRCAGVAVDVHEVLARSAGGSILDEANCMTSCRTGHTWIGDHPKEALALGLRRSRYEGRNPS